MPCHTPISVKIIRILIISSVFLTGTFQPIRQNHNPSERMYDRQKQISESLPQYYYSLTEIPVTSETTLKKKPDVEGNIPEPSSRKSVIDQRIPSHSNYRQASSRLRGHSGSIPPINLLNIENNRRTRSGRKRKTNRSTEAINFDLDAPKNITVNKLHQSVNSSLRNKPEFHPTITNDHINVSMLDTVNRPIRGSKNKAISSKMDILIKQMISQYKNAKYYENKTFDQPYNDENNTRVSYNDSVITTGSTPVTIAINIRINKSSNSTTEVPPRPTQETSTNSSLLFTENNKDSEIKAKNPSRRISNEYNSTLRETSDLEQNLNASQYSTTRKFSSTEPQIRQMDIKLHNSSTSNETRFEPKNHNINNYVTRKGAVATIGNVLNTSFTITHDLETFTRVSQRNNNTDDGKIKNSNGEEMQKQLILSDKNDVSQSELIKYADQNQTEQSPPISARSQARRVIETSRNKSSNNLSTSIKYPIHQNNETSHSTGDVRSRQTTSQPKIGQANPENSRLSKNFNDSMISNILETRTEPNPNLQTETNFISTQSGKVYSQQRASNSSSEIHSLMVRNTTANSGITNIRKEPISPNTSKNNNNPYKSEFSKQVSSPSPEVRSVFENHNSSISYFVQNDSTSFEYKSTNKPSNQVSDKNTPTIIKFPTPVSNESFDLPMTRIERETAQNIEENAFITEEEVKNGSLEKEGINQLKLVINQTKDFELTTEAAEAKITSNDNSNYVSAHYTEEKEKVTSEVGNNLVTSNSIYTLKSIERRDVTTTRENIQLTKNHEINEKIMNGYGDTTISESDYRDRLRYDVGGNGRSSTTANSGVRIKIDNNKEQEVDLKLNYLDSSTQSLNNDFSVSSDAEPKSLLPDIASSLSSVAKDTKEIVSFSPNLNNNDETDSITLQFSVPGQTDDIKLKNFPFSSTDGYSSINVNSYESEKAKIEQEKDFSDVFNSPRNTIPYLSTERNRDKRTESFTSDDIQIKINFHTTSESLIHSSEETHLRKNEKDNRRKNIDDEYEGTIIRKTDYGIEAKQTVIENSDSSVTTNSGILKWNNEKQNIDSILKVSDPLTTSTNNELAFTGPDDIGSKSSIPDPSLQIPSSTVQAILLPENQNPSNAETMDFSAFESTGITESKIYFPTSGSPPNSNNNNDINTGNSVEEQTDFHLIDTEDAQIKSQVSTPVTIAASSKSTHLIENTEITKIDEHVEDLESDNNNQAKHRVIRSSESSLGPNPRIKTSTAVEANIDLDINLPNLSTNDGIPVNSLINTESKSPIPETTSLSPSNTKKVSKLPVNRNSNNMETKSALQELSVSESSEIIVPKNSFTTVEEQSHINNNDKFREGEIDISQSNTGNSRIKLQLSTPDTISQLSESSNSNSSAEKSNINDNTANFKDNDVDEIKHRIIRSSESSMSGNSEIEASTNVKINVPSNVKLTDLLTISINNNFSTPNATDSESKPSIPNIAFPIPLNNTENTLSVPGSPDPNKMNTDHVTKKIHISGPPNGLDPTNPFSSTDKYSNGNKNIDMSTEGKSNIPTETETNMPIEGKIDTAMDSKTDIPYVTTEEGQIKTPFQASTSITVIKPPEETYVTESVKTKKKENKNELATILEDDYKYEVNDRVVRSSEESIDTYVTEIVKTDEKENKNELTTVLENDYAYEVNSRIVRSSEENIDAYVTEIVKTDEKENKNELTTVLEDDYKYEVNDRVVRSSEASIDAYVTEIVKTDEKENKNELTTVLEDDYKYEVNDRVVRSSEASIDASVTKSIKTDGKESKNELTTVPENDYEYEVNNRVVRSSEESIDTDSVIKTSTDVDTNPNLKFLSSSTKINDDFMTYTADNTNTESHISSTSITLPKNAEEISAVSKSTDSSDENKETTISASNDEGEVKYRVIRSSESSLSENPEFKVSTEVEASISLDLQPPDLATMSNNNEPSVNNTIETPSNSPLPDIPIFSPANTEKTIESPEQPDLTEIEVNPTTLKLPVQIPTEITEPQLPTSTVNVNLNGDINIDIPIKEATASKPSDISPITEAPSPSTTSFLITETNLDQNIDTLTTVNSQPEVQFQTTRASVTTSPEENKITTTVLKQPSPTLENTPFSLIPTEQPSIQTSTTEVEREDEIYDIDTSIKEVKGEDEVYDIDTSIEDVEGEDEVYDIDTSIEDAEGEDEVYDIDTSIEDVEGKDEMYDIDTTSMVTMTSTKDLSEKTSVPTNNNIDQEWTDSVTTQVSLGSEPILKATIPVIKITTIKPQISTISSVKIDVYTTEELAEFTTERAQTTTENPLDFTKIQATTEKPPDITTIRATTEKPLDITTIRTTTEKPLDITTILATTEKPLDITTIRATTKKSTDTSTEEIQAISEKPIDTSTEKVQVTTTTKPIVVSMEEAPSSSIEPPTTAPIFSQVLVKTLPSSENLPVQTLPPPAEEMQVTTPSEITSIPFEFTIDADFDEVVGNRKSEFESNLHNQLGIAMRLPFECIQNLKVTKGSIDVSFNIVPSTEHGHIADEKAIKAASDELKRLIDSGKLDLNDLDGNGLIVVPIDPPTTPPPVAAAEHTTLILGVIIGVFVITVIMVIVGAIMYKRKSSFSKRLSPIEEVNSKLPSYRDIPFQEALFKKGSGSGRGVQAVGKYCYNSGQWLGPGPEPKPCSSTPGPVCYRPPTERELRKTPRPPTAVRERLRNRWDLDWDSMVSNR